MTKGSGLSSDEELVALVVVGFAAAAAVAAVPALIGARVEMVTAWLLSHHLLLPASQSLLTLPGVAAGLDLRRLVVLAALVVVVAALARVARSWIPRRRG